MSKWTENQSLAINTLTGDVLVTASAGSGKTSVMIERLMKLVVEEGVDVGRILCLTFTRSSAEEMRARLKSALIERAQTAEGEEYGRIVDNLDDLAFADVTTIDAFCSKITKKYFENADGGVNPTLATESEAGALKYASAVKVLNDFGESDDTVYYELLGFLGKKRGEDSFVELIMSLGEYLSSIPDPEGYLDEAVERYVAKIKENEVSKSALLGLFEEARYIEAMTVPLLGWDLPYVDEVRERMLRINSMKSQGFEAVYPYLDAQFPDKPRYNRRPYSSKKESKDDILQLYQTVSAFEKKWSGLCVDTFVSDVTLSKVYVGKLAEIMKAYRKEYADRLKRENLTDFSAVSHEALRLLSIPEIQKEVRSVYSHVLIDEYQDTNRLQEEILCASGGEESTFVVGDEKQSIYAFRHAEPEIFSERRRREGVKVINLSDNFRQDGRIIEVVNGVFSSIMTEHWSGVDYKGEKMRAGIDYPQSDQPAVEMFIVDADKKDGEKEPLPEVYSVKGGAIEQKTGCMKEALYVESTIRRLVGNTLIYDAKRGISRPVAYGDIVVISRNRSEGVKRIAERLRLSGIPVGIRAKAKLPSSAEILITYLRLIQNPTLDEALAISMLSPLFSFTEDDLARYRIDGGENESLWACFEKSRNKEEKLDRFFAVTENYISRSRYMNVHDLIESIVTERDYLLSLARTGDGDIKSLLTYIDGLGSDTTARSVSDYLAYFDSYPKFETDVDTGGGDVVRFMTMHGAKGLEFPVVFLVETGRKFSSREDNEPVNYHKRLGIGIQTFITKERLKRRNFVYKTIRSRIKEEQAIEEMRLLYVAMTRAKNLLFISGALSKDASTNKNERLATSHLGFIKTAVNNDPTLLSKIRTAGIPTAEEKVVEKRDIIPVDLTFNYPDEQAVITPVKYTVTGLLDTTDEVSYPLTKSESAEVGTLYHKVMQNIPFDTEAKDLKRAFSKLVLDGIVSEEEIATVSEEIIKRVLSLPVIKRASGLKCLKEQEFLLHVPHSEIVEGGIADEVVLQGVIDLLVLDEKPIVIDYKYSGKSAENLRKTYEKQLRLYERAVKDILGVDEVEVYLISLKSAECISI